MPPQGKELSLKIPDASPVYPNEEKTKYQATREIKLKIFSSSPDQTTLEVEEVLTPKTRPDQKYSLAFSPNELTLSNYLEDGKENQWSEILKQKKQPEYYNESAAIATSLCLHLPFQPSIFL